MRPMIKARVLQERCTGCGVCEQLCPMEAIGMEGGKALVLDHCSGCMMCMQGCTTEAIQPMYLEPEPEMAQTGPHGHAPVARAWGHGDPDR